jgi:hypothetical protein
VVKLGTKLQEGSKDILRVSNCPIHQIITNLTNRPLHLGVFNNMQKNIKLDAHEGYAQTKYHMFFQGFIARGNKPMTKK